MGVSRTYYQANRAEYVSQPQFEGTTQVDVAIIGGGLAGLSVAFGLASRGRSPLVLEAKDIAWGASGRNGGFVSAGFDISARDLVQRVGMKSAQELYSLTQDAVELVRKRASEWKTTETALESGLVGLSLHDDDTLQGRADWLANTFGERREIWPAGKVREHWRSKRYHSAVFNPTGFTMNPINYSTALTAALISAGGLVYEHSPAVKITLLSKGGRIYTNAGVIEAGDIVICCSGYIGSLAPQLSRATLALATSVLVTEPLGAKLDSAINLPHGASDLLLAMDYYRPLPDTRLLWGGGMSAFRRTSLSPAFLLKHIAAVYPQLGPISAEFSWNGIMGYSAHGMPQIGQLHPGLWYTQGFGGHGLATTTMAGELIASAIATRDDRWKQFFPFKLRSTYGGLGRLTAQCFYWSQQMRDKWNLRRRHS